MRYVDEFRDAALAQALAARIAARADRPLTFMEICGTHTMAIARHGLKALLPPHVRLISGPGCPVCVTPQAEIDRFIALGREPDVILTSFGDMLRVPGRDGTLETARARGADVRVVYAPLDAVALAAAHPDRRVVFCGVGFETTAPATALAVREAARRGVTNFFLLCAHKTLPRALAALSADPALALHGYLCPGHVSVITGTGIYAPIARDFHLPCVVAGFEPLDILQAVYQLVAQAVEGRAEVEIQYARAVTRDGNPAARACLEEVFAPADAVWRGLGVIPGSGLRIRAVYAAHDAAQFLPLAGDPAPEPAGCACGRILRGQCAPADCAHFGAACNPAYPLGPCMVSSEGACAAAYRYERGAVHV